jgi:hypothetical protein
VRALVVALLVANVAFWAWTQGWLDGLVGVSPLGDREPARVERQVDPQRVRVVTAAAVAPAAPAPAPAPAPADAATACLEAGPFSPLEAIAAEAALVRAALPPGSWRDVRVDRPGTWVIYVGRFASREQMTQREDELRRLRIAFEPVRVADLEPGLVLGSYDARAGADEALQQFIQRGVPGARVVATAPPSTTHLLRVERADAALQAQLAALRAPALGNGFVRCATAAR